MMPGAGALLNMLGSGVGLIQQITGSGKAPVEGASFKDLLGRLEDGTLRAGEPIRLGTGSKLELSRDQLERLGDAAATLESSGAQRAVIMLDGMAIEYDVQSRTVIGEIDLDDGGAVTGIDALIHARSAGESGAKITTPSFGYSPSGSLLRALGEGAAA